MAKIRNRYVVGDIHGSLSAFKQVLERSDFDNNKDQLIFLGDYVDGWSESAELIDFLINIKEICTHEQIFLKGNHDTWVQKWLNKGQSDTVWLMNGGASTVESYVTTGFFTDETHKDFFNTLRDFYVDDEDRAFVHAGFRSQEGLGYDDEHTYLWERLFWSLQMQPNNPKANPSKFYREVYIGHTPTTNFVLKGHYPERNRQLMTDKNSGINVPMLRYNVWNMDTGSGWNGKLSLMNIDTKEVFQSDVVSTLHPNEKGRMG